MSDQADTLRRLMEQRLALAERERGATRDPGPSTPVLTVASGKGGVGKSCLVANVGAALARSGLRVLLVDADMGLANLDILLGVHPQATLEQVMDGEASLQEAVVGIEPNLWLIPSSSGLVELRAAPVETRARLIRVFESCPWEMDLILVDAGAGIQDNVLSLHRPTYESLVVLTPEPTALADAYGLVKLLRKKAGIQRVNVIVNQVTDGREGLQTFQKLRDVAAKFVDTRLEYLGHLQRDEKITQAVMKRKILLDLDPGAASVPCLDLLAKRLRSKFAPSTGRLLASGRFREEPTPSVRGNTTGFWRTLLGEVKT